MSVDFAQSLLQEYKLSNWQDIYAVLFNKCELFKRPVQLDTKNNAIKNSYEVGSADLNGEKILFFDVEVQPNIVLRKNRVTLNNSLVRWLATSNADAAIGVFHSKKESSYRFTFVRSSFQFSDDGKIRERRTNPRRYTYILGPDSHCLTAIQRFQKLQTEPNVTLDKVEEAFSVEALTKQFYRELFDWYQWAASDEINAYYPNLDTAPDKNQALQEHLIRLITRLVFVWFIKQKGLVPDELFKPAKVAEKLKNFKPYDMKQCTYYKCYLQNLFFATLNREIGERAFAAPANAFNQAKARDYGVSTLYRHAEEFKCSNNEILALFKKVPYLNGGLFECLDKKDEVENTPVVYVDGFSRRKSARLPNALFFDEAKGIIPLLERYNFTVEENTALDQTVALDPELLGKVFENLLGAYNPETQQTARNESGSFYTPREIVDYMVDESLVAYLKSNSIYKYEKDVLESLIRDDQLPKQIEENDRARKEFSRLLRCVKILDPACGSGAFPVGALNRIVTILRKLSKTQLDEYETKMHLIEKCLYGVDIQNIAVQISKLRFFISLICEQEPILEDTTNNYGIKPLPNLETRFVAANSLISLNKGDRVLDFDGVSDIRQELFEISQNLICPKNRTEKKQLQKKEKALRQKIKELLLANSSEPNPEKIERLQKEVEELQKKRLAVASPDIQSLVQRDVQQNFLEEPTRQEEIKIDANEPERKRIDARIKILKSEIVKEQNRGKYSDEATRIAEKLISWNSSELNNTADFFDPDWMFAIKDGFDIVIGNPPYIQLQSDGGKLADLYEDEKFETFKRTGDIYCLFYERGWQLLKENGHLCFITSNKWMRADYGKLLREFLANKTNPELLIDLGPKVFESATVDTNILLFAKSNDNTGKTCSCIAKEGCRNDLSGFFRQHATECAFTTSDSWVILNPIEQSIKRKIEAIGTPLKDWDIKINRGILTGCNDAFIIDEAKKEELIKEDPKSAEIIRPILRGRDIKRYGYDWAHLYLIATFPARHYDIEQYPAVKKYLLSFDKERLLAAGYDDIANNSKLLREYCQQRLEQSGKDVIVGGRKVVIDGKAQKSRKKTGNKWFETQDQIGYWEDFNNQKIVYREISDVMDACIVDSRFVINNKCYMITGDHITYLISLLNSKLFTKIILPTANITGGKGGDFIQKITSPIPSNDVESILESLLKRREKANSQQVAFIDAEVDSLICKLFGLSKVECSYIMN